MGKKFFVIIGLCMPLMSYGISWSDMANKASGALSSVGETIVNTTPGVISTVGQTTLNVAKGVGSTVATGAAYALTGPYMNPYGNQYGNPYGMGMYGGGMPISPLTPIGAVGTNMSNWGGGAAAQVTPNTVNVAAPGMVPPYGGMPGAYPPMYGNPSQMVGGMVGAQLGQGLLGPSGGVLGQLAGTALASRGNVGYGTYGSVPMSGMPVGGMPMGAYPGGVMPGYGR